MVEDNNSATLITISVVSLTCTCVAAYNFHSRRKHKHHSVSEAKVTEGACELREEPEMEVEPPIASNGEEVLKRVVNEDVSPRREYGGLRESIDPREVLRQVIEKEQRVKQEARAFYDEVKQNPEEAVVKRVIAERMKSKQKYIALFEEARNSREEASKARQASESLQAKLQALQEEKTNVVRYMEGTIEELKRVANSQQASLKAQIKALEQENSRLKGLLDEKDKEAAKSSAKMGEQAEDAVEMARLKAEVRAERGSRRIEAAVALSFISFLYAW